MNARGSRNSPSRNFMLTSNHQASSKNFRPKVRDNSEQRKDRCHNSSSAKKILQNSAGEAADSYTFPASPLFPAFLISRRQIEHSLLSVRRTTRAFPPKSSLKHPACPLRGPEGASPQSSPRLTSSSDGISRPIYPLARAMYALLTEDLWPKRRIGRAMNKRSSCEERRMRS